MLYFIIINNIEFLLLSNIKDEFFLVLFMIRNKKLIKRISKCMLNIMENEMIMILVSDLFLVLV